MIFNPAVIVLGGDLLQGEDLLVPRIKSRITLICRSSRRERIFESPVWVWISA
jgi:hypothetical protein